MEETITLTNVFWINVGIIGWCVLSLLFIVILWSKLNRLRKSYLKVMNGSNGTNVEQLLMDAQKKINVLQDQAKQQEVYNQKVKLDMGKMKSNIGIQRYNAFSNQGNDLSFSIAIIDDTQNGVVISSIHGRDDSYVYAKPLTEGQSRYALSPEEKEAINLALKS